jgi:DNA-directed RNA polymerase subunit RPC12/RpoP
MGMNLCNRCGREMEPCQDLIDEKKIAYYCPYCLREDLLRKDGK